MFFFRTILIRFEIFSVHLMNIWNDNDSSPSHKRLQFHSFLSTSTNSSHILSLQGLSNFRVLNHFSLAIILLTNVIFFHHRYFSCPLFFNYTEILLTFFSLRSLFGSFSILFDFLSFRWYVFKAGIFKTLDCTMIISKQKYSQGKTITKIKSYRKCQWKIRSTSN